MRMIWLGLTLEMDKNSTIKYAHQFREIENALHYSSNCIGYYVDPPSFLVC